MIMKSGKPTTYAQSNRGACLQYGEQELLTQSRNKKIRTPQTKHIALRSPM